MVFSVVDSEGYRLNVGIVIANPIGQLLWARRAGGGDNWQFPQGGIGEGETVKDSLFRELQEEVGLKPSEVEIVYCSRSWFRYKFPSDLVKQDNHFTCIGQKQQWFLLRFVAEDQSIKLDLTANPEFDLWRWVDYWQPIDQVVEFKRTIYRQILEEFEEPLHKALENQND